MEVKFQCLNRLSKLKNSEVFNGVESLLCNQSTHKPQMRNLWRRRSSCLLHASLGKITICIPAFFFFFFIGFHSCEAQKSCNSSSSCGNLINISYPFRLSSDPSDCGDHRYNLHCENNRTVLYLYSGKYYVETISYETRSMRVVDSGLQIHNCSSLPLHSLTREVNFTYEDPFFYPRVFQLDNYIVFLNCDNPIDSPLHLVSTSPCINGSSSSGSRYSYAFVGDLTVSDIPDSCTISTIVPIGLQEAGNRSFSEIHHEMAMGFDLSWYRIDCGICEEIGLSCYPSEDLSSNYTCSSSCTEFYYKTPMRFQLQCGTVHGSSPKINIYELMLIIGYILKFLIARSSFGYICFFTFLIYYMLRRRRHLSSDTNIEEFLQERNNLLLVQYSYSEIKKMTKQFSDKLGQGGYGSVYKGKLRSGNLVAIKMLANSKGNGQDFINEVSTIGMIHHVNVVRLIGFCFEGSKRALVYDFMPNGSLDRYIFTQEQKDTIYSSSWENMYKIALGVAHGIEYLHRGCGVQILHFDIKPHNILLDEDYTPKISDFGLAKLYRTNDNTVPLTAARGTIGYIAPELFYKSMGGVSFKADVYSFGMLLMDMAGRRKNVNPFANTESQIYFPSWIYDKLNEVEDLEMEDATVDEIKTAKKLIIVALSCIQMKPVDRPSMSKVIEMLESPTENLQMPPKPFLASFGTVEHHPIVESSPISQLSDCSSSYDTYNLTIRSNQL